MQPTGGGGADLGKTRVHTACIGSSTLRRGGVGRSCVLAAATSWTRSTPAAYRACAAVRRVVPVVTTSSTSNTARPRPRTPRPKRRTNQPVGSRFTGLRRTVGPIQEPTARNAQLTSDGLGDGLGLVVAASAYPTGTRGRPCDHVDVVEAEPSDHVRGKDARRGSTVTELESDDQLTRHALERERGRDAIGTAHRCDRSKREPAAVAQHIANTPAGAAPTGKQHGGINTRGV